MPALEGESPVAREPAEPLLSLRHLTKAFGGTLAVSDVSFDIRRGEILALLGQNGAGKSTIIKVLAGVYRPDSGTITMNGVPFEPGRALRDRFHPPGSWSGQVDDGGREYRVGAGLSPSLRAGGLERGRSHG